MAISGHKTRAIFERYNIVSGHDLKDAASKLETYLSKQGTKKPMTRLANRDNLGTIAVAGRSSRKQYHVN
jgi:hypothetical protein